MVSSRHRRFRNETAHLRVVSCICVTWVCYGSNPLADQQQVLSLFTPMGEVNVSADYLIVSKVKYWTHFTNILTLNAIFRPTDQEKVNSETCLCLSSTLLWDLEIWREEIEIVDKNKQQNKVQTLHLDCVRCCTVLTWTSNNTLVMS